MVILHVLASKSFSCYRPCQINKEPIASTIVIESTSSKLATVPSKTTTTDIPSTSATNNIENITIIDTNSLEESSNQAIIIIDDNKTDNQQKHISKKSTTNKQQIDPWTPISDEIDAALEQALDEIDSTHDRSPEFTPTTARRTETEVMAALLPKMPLKRGRFRAGRPISDCITSDAANEYQPSGTGQSSPPTSSIITNR